MTIYFVRHADLVKIGFTDDLRQRMLGLRATMPVDITLVGHMPGGREVEAHFHQVFAASRARGEWFQITPQLASFMALMLIAELPVKREPTPRTNKVSKIKWDAYSANLRELAFRLWPGETHKNRLKHLCVELGWGERRVRSLYDNDGYGRLIYEEVVDLDALFLKHGIAPEIATD